MHRDGRHGLAPAHGPAAYRTEAGLYPTRRDEPAFLIAVSLHEPLTGRSIDEFIESSAANQPRSGQSSRHRLE